MSAYSDWQQSVDGPDELSREEQIVDAMFDLLLEYGIDDLIDKLGHSRDEVFDALINGVASDSFIGALNRLMNEGVELEAPVIDNAPIEF